MKLTIEQLKLLAELERKMDSGEIPYVMLNNQRYAVSKTAMQEFNLSQGQTINNTLRLAIMEFSLAEVQMEIAKEEANAAIEKASQGSKV